MASFSSVSELSALRPEQVERIEVLRGAASARFGAEAMGGAIAVTTRRAGGRENPCGQPDARAGFPWWQLHPSLAAAASGVSSPGLCWRKIARTRASAPCRASPLSLPDHCGRRAWPQQLPSTASWPGTGRDFAASLNLKHSDNHSFLGRPNWIFRLAKPTPCAASFPGRVNETLVARGRAGRRPQCHGRRCAIAAPAIDAAGLAADQWLTQDTRQREASAALNWQDSGLAGAAGRQPDRTVGTIQRPR